MKIALAIESSCDDSAVAIVRNDKKILSNLVSSQINEHKLYKGVVPEIASRAHMKVLKSLITKSLEEANLDLSDISLIAATGGPGLIGGVITGTMYAKGLSSASKIPYLPVNHLEGHALTARLTNDVEFPYLLLLVSGGHCQFVIVEALGKYQLIGSTQDDAVGEAFDKVAKMLDLGFPGGPAVEQKALKGNAKKYIFPKPMCDRSGCDMSFSGLKTSVRNLIIKNKDNINEELISDICASFQHTILQILEYKIDEAISEYLKQFKVKNIVISGGVAANKYLITNLERSLKDKGFTLISPPGKLCTDNAAMIAWAGLEHFSKTSKNFIDFCPRSNWPLSEIL